MTDPDLPIDRRGEPPAGANGRPVDARAGGRPETPGGQAGRTGYRPPRVEPVDPPMVPFAVAGTVAWAIAGLVLLALHGTLAAHGETWWLWTCLAGVALGLVGLVTMIRHDRGRRRRRAARSAAPAA